MNEVEITAKECQEAATLRNVIDPNTKKRYNLKLERPDFWKSTKRIKYNCVDLREKTTRGYFYNLARLPAQLVGNASTIEQHISEILYPIKKEWNTWYYKTADDQVNKGYYAGTCPTNDK